MINTSKLSEIEDAFFKIKDIFPFGEEYLMGALNKTKIIASLIIKNYPDGGNILSIGAGPCYLEAILSELGYGVTAVEDLNDHWHLIGDNKKRIINFALKMKVDLKIKSIYSISGDLKKQFDIVLGLDVIEHLYNPRDFLNCAVSCLKEEGLLILETPNVANLKNRMKMLLGKSSQINADLLYWNLGDFRFHIKEYTVEELKRILRHHNLKDIKVKLYNSTGVDKKLQNKNLLASILVRSYKVLTLLNPFFKSTQLISSKKPKKWVPVQPSMKEFKKVYPHLEKYNMNNVNDEEIKESIDKHKSQKYPYKS